VRRETIAPVDPRSGSGHPGGRGSGRTAEREASPFPSRRSAREARQAHEALQAREARRAREGHRNRQARVRLVSLLVTAATAIGVGAVTAAESRAETTYTRASYAPGASTGWRNDATVGLTDSADQFAQADVAGLLDGQHSAGFRLRYASRYDQVLVAVSGTGWLIQPSVGSGMTGAFVHGSTGLFRAEIEGSTVRLRWNGVLVASRQITGTYSGRHVVTTVRQPQRGVRMALIRAASLPGATTAGTAPQQVGAPGTWLSGAAGTEAANGTFGVWRGSAVTVGGTWTDTYEAQTDQWMICGGPWGTWNKPLDLAVGAIYSSRGETWSAAARGAYTARWTKALTRIKTCWGSRDPGNLYLRFAHEMNLSSSPWAVRKGQEANFVAAMTIFSDLRYTILPRAKLVFCPNDGTDGALGGLDIRALWPGKDRSGRQIAQVYGADSYNAWPQATTAAAFKSKINGSYSNGAPLGLEKHRQLAATLGVPFAVPEWANHGTPGTANGGGGEAEAYVREFNAWARAHSGDVTNPKPGQVLYEVHFNMWTEYSFWPKTVQSRTAAAYRALIWGH
jgi:hypothetical protein